MADHPAPEAEPPGGSHGKPGPSALRRFGGVLLVIAAFLLFRALTADDGTHGIEAGQCIAPAGTEDFARVDCADPTSLGVVTFVDRNVPTDEASALRLCSSHGASEAFRSATSEGGGGTVVCLAPRTGTLRP
jgi:hypothetical protein